MKPVLSNPYCLTLLLLPGCASRAPMPPLPEAALTTIAHDATGQLASLYPPAQTHLELKTAGETSFDGKLKSQLRQRGYALHENGEATSQAKPGGKQLSYVLDALTDVQQYGYYRLTLNVGDGQLSRLYDADDVGKPNYWTCRK